MSSFKGFTGWWLPSSTSLVSMNTPVWFPAPFDFVVDFGDVAKPLVFRANART
jgi:hypothetical protein